MWKNPQPKKSPHLPSLSNSPIRRRVLCGNQIRSLLDKFESVTEMHNQESDEIQKLFRQDLFKSPNYFHHFMKMELIFDLAGTYLLEGMSESNREIIGEGVTAIILDKDVSVEPGALAQSEIYERDFYESLFSSIRKASYGVCLVGSTGTSKSTYQFWLLNRYIQAVHHGK
jgi:hypothetical protein